MMSLVWVYDDKPFFWAWLVVAVLCGCVIAMLDGADTRFKIKVAVPSVLLGAAIVMTGGAAYYWREHYYNSGGVLDFPFFTVWGTAVTLLIVIVHLIKQPVQQR